MNDSLFAAVPAGLRFYDLAQLVADEIHDLIGLATAPTVLRLLNSMTTQDGGQ